MGVPIAYQLLNLAGVMGRGYNSGEVSSVHILAAGNVAVGRLCKGDYGNPFILNFARVGEW